ncbi:MAG: hypothetical protein ACP5GE_06580, partial [Thermoplasmata archaeon]
MDKNVNISNLDVKKIFGESKYVKEINNLKDGIYEIIFSWKKFGITKEFPVKVQELKNEKNLLIENTQDSKFRFKLKISSIDFMGEKTVNTRVMINAEMGAGILADLFGENDFKLFIHDSVIPAIEKHCIIKSDKAQVDVEGLQVRIEPKNSQKKVILARYLPQSLLEKLSSGDWVDANQEITCLLTKDIDNMNLWLIKAYVSEKCNLEKLARVYLEYIASKDEML